MATESDPVVSFDNQSVEVEGGARRSQLCSDGELISYIYEDAKTLYEVFQRGKKVSGDGPCLGFKPDKDTPYQWLTYSQIEERALAFGAGLVDIGISPGQDSFVGIYAPNCVDWVVMSESSHAYSRVIVPLYDTLGQESLVHIINQAEMVCVVCALNKVANLAGAAASCPTMKKLVVIGETINDETRKFVEEANLEIFTIKEIEVKGKNNPVDVVLPKPDDLETVSYTSGTTGLPKGVMITHGNFVAEISGVTVHLKRGIMLTSEDVHISYLPLAHMLERAAQAQIMMHGARIGFFQGDVKTLVNDIQELKPTLFVSVPRLLNRVYDKILAGVKESRLKNWLFNKAYQSKQAEVQRGRVRSDSLWDFFVFGKIQKLLGGRVRFIMSSSAPISAQVLEFFRVTMGCQVVEGYGQTEVTAAATMSVPGDNEPGHVGPPIPCSLVKLVDVPEMNYFASEGEGEVCFKGPTSCKGYYKMPEKTAELIDEDGWVHSGDVGKWLPNGALKIIDRVKNIFKLSQGEYLAPEKIENICTRSIFVAQMFLYGDSLKSCCVAIVVPDEEILVRWAEETERGSVPFEDLCKDEEVKTIIYSDIVQVAKDGGLNSLEIPKAITLCSEMFSVENDILTPTFKLKRPFAREHFKTAINEMYAQFEQ